MPKVTMTIEGKLQVVLEGDDGDTVQGLISHALGALDAMAEHLDPQEPKQQVGFAVQNLERAAEFTGAGYTATAPLEVE